MNTAVAPDDETETNVELSTTRRPMRVGIILLSHAVIDCYSTIVPSMLGLIEAHCQLQKFESSLIIAGMSLVSGVAQPICAAISDRYDSRLFGGLGLAIGAVFLCLLGRVAAFPGLLGLVLVGYFGIGIFHPIAASSVGEISNRWRSLAMSGFFMAGMTGAAMGARWLPRFVGDSDGLQRLEVLILPGIIVAAFLHFSVRNVSHRRPDHANLEFEPNDLRSRWKMVWILYFATTMRAVIYVTMQYLIVRWVQFHTAIANPELTEKQIADIAAPAIGDLISMMIIGMAAGGLASGIFIRQGREKLPLILIPILFSPAIVWFPHAPVSLARWLGLFAGFGFASMSPVVVALAQRLLPHRTSLASSLMLGAAWAVAAIGPILAEPGIGRIGINGVFLICGVVLALSGLIAVRLRSTLLRASVELR